MATEEERAIQLERPRLATRRLILRRLAISDATEMAALVGDPGLYTFTSDQPPTLEELTEMYRRLLRGPDAAGEWWGHWVLVERTSSRLVGVASALIWFADGGRAQVAWVVGTAHQGQGLAKEAATALVGWLRGLPLVRIEAHIHPEHAVSAAVATSSGLEPRSAEIVDGEVVWCWDRGGGEPIAGT